MHITADREAHLYVSALVAVAPGEIGGIGYVQLVDKGHFHISEFVLLEQEATFGSVDFEGDAYVQEITRAAEDNRENELRLSWHSHGDMDTYWSRTDEEGVKEYAALGMPWLVSLVFNKAGEVEGRLDIFDHETASQIKLTELEYEVEFSSEIMERAEEDVKKLVKKPKVKYSSAYGGNTNRYKGSSKSPATEKNEHMPTDKRTQEMYSQAWADYETELDDDFDFGKDDKDDEDGEILPMPSWLEVEDFLDVTRYSIMEMEYGSACVEAWEEELFHSDGTTDLTVVEDDDGNEELRILTP